MLLRALPISILHRVNISRGFPVHNFRMIYCSDLNLGLCLSFANKTERVPATATGSFNNSEREREREIDN